jgi:hypothetical protein
VGDGKIRFNYRTNQRGDTTCDIHYYYYWVPLGKLDAGVYYLELYDGSLDAVTLSRRIEIQPPRAKKLR